VARTGGVAFGDVASRSAGWSEGLAARSSWRTPPTASAIAPASQRGNGERRSEIWPGTAATGCPFVIAKATRSEEGRAARATSMDCDTLPPME